jgi:hypothetical protein
VKGDSPTATGGTGGGGFYNKPITQPFSQPYSVGGSGGNTTMANVGTVNAGNAAPGGGSGNSGTQPGSSLTVPSDFRQGPVGVGVSAPPTVNARSVHFGAGGQNARGDFMEGGVIQTSAGPNPGAIIVFENSGT